MSVVVPRVRKKASSKRVTFRDLAAVCSSNRHFCAPIYGSKWYMRVCAHHLKIRDGSRHNPHHHHRAFHYLLSGSSLSPCLDICKTSHPTNLRTHIKTWRTWREIDLTDQQLRFY